MTTRKKQPYRVVVVDDSATFRATLVRFLAALPDFQVIAEAENGEDALQVIEATSPDILLLDIRMPKMNGIEVLQHLQAMKKSVLVVVLSAHEDSYSEQAMASGATAFVGKGDIPKLLQTLSILVKGDSSARKP